MVRVLTSYHFWYATTWMTCLIVYSWGWSELNQPLRPDLLAFLLISALVSVLILVVQTIRRSDFSSESRVVHRTGRRDGRRLTALFIAGFAADFWYQGGIPFLHRGYAGYDITTELQSTVGIPIVHVILIAGVIFFALERADRFFVQRHSSFAVQYVLLLLLLLLNNSRGYMTFVLIGTLLLFLARRFAHGGRVGPAAVFLAALAAVALLYGIGVFGNVRSGSAWWDSSQITHLGRYQDHYPQWLSPQFQWAYTYFTSPLGNLNLNLSIPTAGSWYDVPLMFIPDSVGKYLLLGRVNVVFQVSYLNASTGYVVPYYLGGGLIGLYIAYALQVVLIELGGAVSRRIGTAVVLYRVCACVVVIVFVFFNSFADVATCFLLPLAVIVGLVRRARQRRSVIEVQPETSSRRDGVMSIESSRRVVG